MQLIYPKKSHDLHLVPFILMVYSSLSLIALSSCSPTTTITTSTSTTTTTPSPKRSINEILDEISSHPTQVPKPPIFTGDPLRDIQSVLGSESGGSRSSSSVLDHLDNYEDRGLGNDKKYIGGGSYHPNPTEEETFDSFPIVPYPLFPPRLVDAFPPTSGSEDYADDQKNQRPNILHDDEDEADEDNKGYLDARYSPLSSSKSNTNPNSQKQKNKPRLDFHKEDSSSAPFYPSHGPLELEASEEFRRKGKQSNNMILRGGKQDEIINFLEYSRLQSKLLHEYGQSTTGFPRMRYSSNKGSTNSDTNIPHTTGGRRDENQNHEFGHPLPISISIPLPQPQFPSSSQSQRGGIPGIGISTSTKGSSPKGQSSYRGYGVVPSPYGGYGVESLDYGYGITTDTDEGKRTPASSPSAYHRYGYRYGYPAELQYSSTPSIEISNSDDVGYGGLMGSHMLQYGQKDHYSSHGDQEKDGDFTNYGNQQQSYPILHQQTVGVDYNIVNTAAMQALRGINGGGGGGAFVDGYTPFTSTNNSLNSITTASPSIYNVLANYRGIFT